MNHFTADEVLHMYLGDEVTALPLPPRVPSQESIERDLAVALKVAHHLGVTMRPGSWSTRPGYGVRS